jgi:hypothetical protein
MGKEIKIILRCPHWQMDQRTESSAYEKIFELMRVTKNTKKSVHDSSFRLLQHVRGFEHPLNLYFARKQIEVLGSSTAAYSLNDVLSKIDDH